MITFTLIGSFYGTLRTYQNHGIIGENGKKVFNTLVTGLSMALGISIASSFKSVALSIRWWILSRKKRPIDEAAQAAVSMLGLTYSLVFTIDSKTQVAGDTLFSNMTQSWGASVDEDTKSSSQLAAHTYGELGLAFSSTILNYSDTDVLPIDYLSFRDSDPIYFKATDYFQYVFEETAASNDSKLDYFYSNRSIVTTSSCNVYPVIDNLNGSSQTFQVEQDGFVHTQYFQSIGPNSTTYLTSPDHGDCGSRCANVYAYETNGTAGFFYMCNITVSDVYNASILEHRVSDTNAKMAASAIALQGYQSEVNYNQSQRYPPQSTYGTFLNGNSADMAYNMRRFSIGVFITADQILSNIDGNMLQVSGFLPASGNQLSIDHPAGMWAIFGGLAGAHLVLLIVGIWFTNRVIVIEDKYLAIAMLLRPVVKEFSKTGPLLGREERESIGQGMSVVYGLRRGEKDGVGGLEISREAECERRDWGWEGWYDS
ncbi:hypothetical protein DL95DRAFT_374802 [Leptodontidium sp. 2 PMI_412]|nr:hypothetical protein DL95DRAFT_374802 [Leptodontidium sp. 2 PMI_412]